MCRSINSGVPDLTGGAIRRPLAVDDVRLRERRWNVERRGGGLAESTIENTMNHPSNIDRRTGRKSGGIGVWTAALPSRGRHGRQPCRPILSTTAPQMSRPSGASAFPMRSVRESPFSSPSAVIRGTNSSPSQHELPRCGDRGLTDFRRSRSGGHRATCHGLEIVIPATARNKASQRSVSRGRITEIRFQVEQPRRPALGRRVLIRCGCGYRWWFAAAGGPCSRCSFRRCGRPPVDRRRRRSPPPRAPVRRSR